MVLPKSKYDEPEVEIVEYRVEGGITGDYTFYEEDDTKRREWRSKMNDELISEIVIDKKQTVSEKDVMDYLDENDDDKTVATETIEKECNDYGDYREQMGKDKMEVNHNLQTYSYKEWLNEK